MGEIPQRKRELDNVHVRYAVCVMRHGTIIGHIPQRISRYTHYFSEEAGKFLAKLRNFDDIHPSIKWQLTGLRTIACYLDQACHLLALRIDGLTSINFTANW